MAKYSVVGKRVPRIDALNKVTGTAVYSGDVILPDMLYGKVLRNPHTHAIIQRLDVTKAQALEGVKAVITASDVPGYQSRSPLLLAEMPHLAQEKVTYAGQPVAVVAATSIEIAEKAVDLIEVEYEELPPILDVLESMKPETPPIYPDLYTNFIASPPSDEDSTPSNIAYHMVINRGDLEAGFKEADLILENTFRTQPVHHGYLEPFAAVASVDMGGKVIVWTQSQGVFTARQMIAAFLDLPASRVNLVPVEIGGAFGGKSFLALAPLCALLALKTGRPVRMEMSRDEVIKAARPAPGSVTTIKMGVTKEGYITAASISLIYDAGGFPEMSHTMFARGNTLSHYKIPNLKIEAFDVLTNKVPVTYYRAPGTPQNHFAVESQMDLIARVLDMDPLQLRIQNIAVEGDTAPSGEILPKVGYKETLERMAEYLKEKGSLQGDDQGRGVACGFWHGATVTFGAYVHINIDGSVTLVVGVTDVSGSRTSIAQIVAEEFGIPMESVSVVVGDTDTAPWASPSVGSQTIYSLSQAVYRACQDAKEQLRHLAAARFEVEASGFEFANGRLIFQGDAEKSIAIGSLARYSISFRGAGPVVGRGSIGGLPPAPSVAVHAADVEIDKETGKVKVLSYAVAQDVGLAVNPLSVEGQIQGAVTQGIGWALMEGYQFDQGKVQNDTLLDYRMPTATDVPMIDALLVEVGSDSGIYGIRHVGEPPIVGALAAIANAIQSATGVRIKELPMTPEAILNGLKEQNKS
ncbi:MAG: xanthine dehydrogenase family protein molybdopterin-binding subunit [Dehalococcoidales bacterium]|nr:MAG: xanthine dehydrogenase family protein molybdopterin-binding subunit [Dehalococcoidales bacterium]